ncbi:hypothetical protein [Chromobacterium rhizoryzae]|uniref:hypothetical protein n=1 Tax=Chromobacterium rhizoryzae TaxID=1778675 RepID=UPI001D08C930|nr:hypothetical protein [Chromobacterium rhizoryzae]
MLIHLLRVPISNAAMLAVPLYGCASRFDLEALATMTAPVFDLNFLPAERR